MTLSVRGNVDRRTKFKMEFFSLYAREIVLVHVPIDVFFIDFSVKKQRYIYSVIKKCVSFGRIVEIAFLPQCVMERYAF